MVLYQKEKGYCYNSDTLFLYDFISLFSPSGDLLDVGSGVGILGLLLKRDFDINLTQIDIQEINTTLNIKNSQTNFIASNIINQNFLEFETTNRYDYIVSNPPFYNAGSLKSNNTHIDISRHSDHLELSKFVKKTNSLLKNRGEFIFCYDAKQIDMVIQCLYENKINICDLKFIHPHMKKDASTVMIRAKKNSKSLVKIHDPLFVFKDEKFTKEANTIFKKSALHSIKVPI